MYYSTQTTRICTKPSAVYWYIISLADDLFIKTCLDVCVLGEREDGHVNILLDSMSVNPDGMRWNEMEWDGIRWNGMEWNMEWDGMG